MHGVSFAHTLDDGSAPSHHRTQYFEMLGHRSLYHDGWRAVCPWPGPSFAEAGVGFGQPISSETLSKLDATGWELYHVDEDFAENHNVAADNRERLIALIATWYAEAGKYDVLPVDGSGIARVLVEKPLLAPPRDRYVFFPDTQSVPFFAGPRVLNRPHSITAEVEIPDDGAEGVLLAQGSAAGGYTFFVKDGVMHYAHNYLGKAIYSVAADTPVPAGTHCASSSSPLVRWTSCKARAHLDECSSTSTVRSSATSRLRYSPARHQSRVVDLRRQSGIASGRGLPGPVPITGTIHRVTSTSVGSSSRTPRPNSPAHGQAVMRQANR